MAWAEPRTARRFDGTLSGDWLPEADELENVRAALAWARDERELGLELRLAAAMGFFWAGSGSLSEGRAWLEDVLSRADDAEPALRGTAANAAAHLSWRQGDQAGARRLAAVGIEIFEELGDRRQLAIGKVAVAIAASQEGDYETEDRLYAEVEPIFRELGNEGGLAILMANRGYTAIMTGDYERAERMTCAKRLHLQRRNGDRLLVRAHEPRARPEHPRTHRRGGVGVSGGRSGRASHGRVGLHLLRTRGPRHGVRGARATTSLLPRSGERPRQSATPPATGSRPPSATSTSAQCRRLVSAPVPRRSTAPGPMAAC